MLGSSICLVGEILFIEGRFGKRCRSLEVGRAGSCSPAAASFEAERRRRRCVLLVCRGRLEHAKPSAFTALPNQKARMAHLVQCRTSGGAPCSSSSSSLPELAIPMCELALPFVPAVPRFNPRPAQLGLVQLCLFVAWRRAEGRPSVAPVRAEEGAAEARKIGGIGAGLPDGRAGAGAEVLAWQRMRWRG